MGTEADNLNSISPPGIQGDGKDIHDKFQPGENEKNRTVF